MKKLIVTLNVFFIMFLSGCVFTDFLSDIFSEKGELVVTNEEVIKSDDKYTLSFDIDTEGLESFNGELDIEINSSETLIFEKEYDFTVNIEQNNYSFEILIIDIELSRKTEGELTFVVEVDNKEYTNTLDIDGLILKDLTNPNLEDVIIQSRSDIARNDLNSNSWTSHSQTNTTNMLSLYDELNSRLETFMLDDTNLLESNKYQITSVSTVSYSLTVDQVLEVYSAVIYDNPIYYFVAKKIGYTSVNGLCSVLGVYSYSYYASSSVRDEYNEDIIDYVVDCIDLTEDLTSELDIALAVHDKIIFDVNYDYSFGDNAFDITGVVSNKGPVCESYAETYFMLLNYLGVDCYLVIGQGVTSSGSESHAWNYVKIDDEWYGVDVTWDDQPSNKNGVIYDYFGKGSNSTFLNTHIVLSHGFHNVDKVISYMVDVPSLSSKNLKLN